MRVAIASSAAAALPCYDRAVNENRTIVIVTARGTGRSDVEGNDRAVMEIGV
jgi:hypothetical protein